MMMRNASARDFLIDRRAFLKYSGFAAVGLAAAGCSGVVSKNASQRRPNIIHILIDDLGYSDVGCNGGDFCETPNIDRLAAQGMRFTSGYSPSPICSPSRAAFLTGKSPARLHFEFVTQYENSHFDWNRKWYDKWADYTLVPPPYTLHLPLEEITVAEALQSAGYTTGMTGKWHVAGHHNRYNGWSLTHGPTQQGFEWAVDSVGSHPWGYKKEDKGKFGPYEAGQYPDDELTELAVRFLSENKDKDKPFFLFVSHYYVHDPLGTQCKWLLDKYSAKAKAMGRNYSSNRILYAAFVETLDHYVGRLLEAIDRLGLADTTLVCFTSDNGGRPVYAFNAPLRGSKWNLYEGGVRVATLARWPGMIQPGTVCDVPMTGMDFMPTYCQVAGAVNRNEHESDGTSILPVLNGQHGREFKERTLYWHFPYYCSVGDYKSCPSAVGIDDPYVSQTPPQSSIRRGDFKLIYFYEDQRCELYNLAEDLGEQKDLSSLFPEQTTQLRQNLFDYLARVNARLPKNKPTDEIANNNNE